MPEFFLELFSEEIPARMQADAAEKLQNALMPTLEDFGLKQIRSFYGPRRIAVVAIISAKHREKVKEVRGPREGAPEAALAGFLGKYVANRDALVVEGGHYILRWQDMGFTAKPEIIAAMRFLFQQRFSWPKSMRWGQSGEFGWVRPLRRIVCLLDGEVVPVVLGPITASDETEGHRVLAPGAFAVSSAKDWEDKLRDHYVFTDPDTRSEAIWEGLQKEAERLDLTVVDDEGLLSEVSGLVEWPVPLIGKIDENFMTLPPEVRELSMKVNQKYFALRDLAGGPAPYFAFVANLEAADGGTAITEGNERVLRARLSDARHFWDRDLKTPLDGLLPKLDAIVFHAKIGTQRARAERIRKLSRQIAELLGADSDEADQAEWAGLLCKADLVTGMVAEFPELQGVIGGYYAERNTHGWNGNVVGPAISKHYKPKGPGDSVPLGTVPCAVALADKLDTLGSFFLLDLVPSGSGDPYALRRAALGVIRIILENKLSLSASALCSSVTQSHPYFQDSLLSFLLQRLEIKLRSDGQRADILNAIYGASATSNPEVDLLRLMQQITTVEDFLQTAAGANLLIAYRRAANILRIEEAKDGPHVAGDLGSIEWSLPEERALQLALENTSRETIEDFRLGYFAMALGKLSHLRTPVDEFFDKVTVNAPEPELRLNRLRLLAQLRDTMHRIADFSKIEG